MSTASYERVAIVGIDEAAAAVSKLFCQESGACTSPRLESRRHSFIALYL